MDRNVDPRDGWQNRLFKLLPAEFTGLFLLARTLADPNRIESDKNIYILFFLLLILLFLYNWRVLNIQRFWKQNFIICVSFIVWCINIELFRLTRGSIQSVHSLQAQDINFWAPVIMGLWVAILIPLVAGSQNWEDDFFRKNQQPVKPAPQDTGDHQGVS